MSTKRPLLITLALLVVFCPLAIDIYLPAFVLIATDFQVDQHALQQTVAVFMLCVGLGQLVAGPLADKLGRKPVAIGGAALYGVAAFAAYIAPSFTWLLFARAIQGFGACATFVVAFAIVRDVYGSKNSAKMLTYLNGVVCFIPALAPILGAWLSVEFGWRMNFLFMAGFALVGAIITALLFTESRPQDTEFSGSLLNFSRFIPILRTPSFVFNSLLAMFCMSAILAFVTAIPGWLIDNLGYSISTFTWWFTINGALSIAASFCAPLLIKRSLIFAIRLGVAIMLLCGVLLLAFAHNHSAAAIMLPMYLCALGYALCLGSSGAAALAPFAKQAGTASALLGLLQMSGAGIVVMLTQQLDLSAPYYLALHLLLLLPFLLLALSSVGSQLIVGDTHAQP